MPDRSKICRLCLAYDVRIISITNTPLHATYDKITNTTLLTVDLRPLGVCYVCYARLKQSHKLMQMSSKAEIMLATMLGINKQITKQSISQIDRQSVGLSNLAVSVIECFDSTYQPTTDRVEMDTGQYLNDVIIGTPLPATTECKVTTQSSVVEEIKVKTENVEDTVATEVKTEQVIDFECTDTALIKIKPENNLDAIKIENENVDPPDLWNISHSVDEVKSEQDTIPLKKTRYNEVEPIIREGDAAELELLEQAGKKTTKYPKHSRAHTAERQYECDCTLPPCYTKCNGEKPYQCNICQRKFSAKCSVLRHIRGVHNIEKPHACQFCQYRFTDKFILEAHLKTHVKCKPYECDNCQYSCYTKTDLQRHFKVHTGQKPFACNICSYRFKTKFALENHLRIHNESYKYDVCQNSFDYVSDLQSHKKAHDAEKYFCKVCQMCFSQKHNLETHMCVNASGTSYKNYVCPHGVLKVNMSPSIYKKITFECKVCHCVFNGKSRLQKHLCQGWIDE